MVHFNTGSLRPDALFPPTRGEMSQIKARTGSLIARHYKNSFARTCARPLNPIIGCATPGSCYRFAELLLQTHGLTCPAPDRQYDLTYNPAEVMLLRALRKSTLRQFPLLCGFKSTSSPYKITVA